jgi:hypothetical protein
MNKIKIGFASLLIFAFIFSACQQRYWYRIKFDFWKKPNKGSCRVHIENHAQHLLKADFDTYMQKVCEKRMKKNNYVISGKDSTDFVLHVIISADTLIGSGTGQTVKASSDQISYYSYNRKQIKQLLFTVMLKEGKKQHIRWVGKADLYYMDDEIRDLGRSIGLVNALIKQNQ